MTRASSITLSTGRKLDLSALAQELTYEGLLEGAPTTKINRRHVDALVAHERAKRSGTAVYLVPPMEIPLPGRDEPGPMGPLAALPRVTCIGRFRSEPIVDSPGCYSELTIIWFQDDFALPVEPSVLEAITRLDWNATAQDDSDW